MAIWSNQLHWEQHFFVSDCRPQHTTGVMSIWRFHVCFFIDCIFMIFLKSDSLNANPESRALLAPNKAPWDGIDAQVKVVYYSSLQWTVDTSHRNIDSERELQRYIFFHCAQRYAVWGSGISLMMQSDSKMTHPAMCLAHHESNSFSIWTYIYIYIYSFPVLFMFELCLTISYFMIKTHCRFDQPMSGTNVGTNVGTHVQGRICSSSGTNVQLFRYRCSGTIVQRPARSRWRSSLKQLS